MMSRKTENARMRASLYACVSVLMYTNLAQHFNNEKRIDYRAIEQAELSSFSHHHQQQQKQAIQRALVSLLLLYKS